LPLAEEVSFWGQIEGEPEHSLLVSLPRPFAAAICERILGAPFAIKEERKLFPSEMALLREQSRHWLDLMAHAWDGITVCACPGPGSDQGATSGERGSWIRFTGDILCGGVGDTPSATGEICLTMDPSTARRLLGQTRLEGESEPWPLQVERRLGDVPLELRALLGRADLSVDRLGALRVGDVITLDRSAHEPVDLIMDGRVFLRARAGLSGGRIALQVL
jgi:flagellar motor switch protein FliM